MDLVAIFENTFILVVRQKLKEYTANRLLRFEKRIQVLFV